MGFVIDNALLVDLAICVLLGLIVGVMTIAMARVLEREKRADVEEFHSMMHCSEEIPKEVLDD